MSQSEIRNKIERALSRVKEPDLGENLVALDLVEADPSGKVVKIRVGTHNPALHARKKFEEECRNEVQKELGSIPFELEAVPLPPENKRPPHLRTVLRNVRYVVAVASGKGGVGKSTVTANLAAALTRKGYKTGIIDADIYGPSQPMMFGVEDSRPGVTTVNGQQLLVPVESHGVKLLSIGFFADMTQPVVWRGPMAVKALKQMFTDADWGELDFLLVDLPPGTGDIHLSLVSDFPLTGSVIVSTPQPVALSDAYRAVAMFRLPQINVPVLGIVENMAYFTPEELPGNKYYLFGEGGAKKLAADTGTPFLGEIPIVQKVREAGDEGSPAALKEDGPAAGAFDRIADSLLKYVKIRAGQPV